MDLTQEFNRQLQNLINKGYHTLAGLSEEAFTALLSPLRTHPENRELEETDLEEGYLPFVIVISSNLIPTEKTMSLVEKTGKTGVTKLVPHTPTDFVTISDVKLPDSPAYLLVDIDRGKETINLPPSVAMQHILEKKRSPLTIDEGVAIVTHYPEFLIKNNCFSLLASRHPGDQRVPAIWINGTKHPNLGWCWDGNPHTWLGSASGKFRLGY